MNRRGQVVLVGAVMIAIAFVPLVLAHLQLGYHDDVRSTGPRVEPTADARSALVRAVHEVSFDAPTTYRWSARDRAVENVRSELEPVIGRIETARIEGGIYRNVSYNATLAGAWADEHCPSGPDRQFGACVTRRGVVVQDRAGWTHVIGVAFDLRATTDRGRVELATVVEPVGDSR